MALKDKTVPETDFKAYYSAMCDYVHNSRVTLNTALAEVKLRLFRRKEVLSSVRPLWQNQNRKQRRRRKQIKSLQSASSLKKKRRAKTEKAPKKPAKSRKKEDIAMTRFSDEEKSIISMYNTADRVGLIVKIKAIPYIEDADLKNTAADIVSKLVVMTDKEFTDLEV